MDYRQATKELEPNAVALDFGIVKGIYVYRKWSMPLFDFFDARNHTAIIESNFADFPELWKKAYEILYMLKQCPSPVNTAHWHDDVHVMD